MHKHLVLALVALSGCAHMSSQKPAVYRATVNSIARPHEARRYLLMPAVEGVTANDLQFQEYAGQVERALAERGYRRVATLDEAELLLLLTYGISGPMTDVQTEVTPVVRYIPGATHSFSGMSTNMGQSSVYTSGTVRESGRYVVERRTETHVETTYLRHFFLGAYEAEAVRAGVEPSQVPQVWQASVRSVGSNESLRRTFPAMVAASRKHFGVSTAGEVSVSIAENDPALHAIRTPPAVPKAAAAAK